MCSECAFDPDESEIYQFRRAVLEENKRFGVEFRFMGALGHGGKFHLNSRWFGGRKRSEGEVDYRMYVSCYPEDQTPERDAMIGAANERLSKLADKYEEMIDVD